MPAELDSRPVLLGRRCGGGGLWFDLLRGRALRSRRRLLRRRRRAVRLGRAALPHRVGGGRGTAHERCGRRPVARRDRRHRTARRDRAVLGEMRVLARARPFVAMLDQQPVGALAPSPTVLGLAVPLHPHEHPRPVQALARERELQVALGDLRVGRGVPLGRPGAAIPELHGAAAILAVRDRALEIAIQQRVVLDLYGQALLRRIERRPLGHRPGLEHAPPFEPQVVVQAGGVVLLDHEAERAAGRWRHLVAARLDRAPEIPHALVAGQLLVSRHGARPVFVETVM